MNDRPMNAADIILAGGEPDAPALVTLDQTLSYGALDALANRFGNGLAARGVERGDRVILMLDDRPALYAAFFGAIRVGAVPIVVNPRWSESELGFAFDDSQARLLIAEPAYEPSAKPAGDRLCVASDGLFDDQSSQLTSLAMAPDDMAFWIYTSGTTGTPKAAIHAHRAVTIADKTMSAVHGVTASDRVFVTSKTFFAYAIGHALLGALKVGASVVLHAPWPKPADIAEVTQTLKPTVMYSVPTFYRAALNDGIVDGGAFSPVRRYVSAGERLPVPLFERWRDATGTAIVEGIGTSETVFMFLANQPDETRPGSAGRPTPGSEVRLETEDGAPINETDEIGVLWTRLDSVAAGYWNQPERTAAAFRDGWFRTGDLFRRDADGFWFHEGRADDMLKIGGQWVNPAEIETCVLKTGLCGEAALVAVLDADGLEKPVLFVADVSGQAKDEPENAIREALNRDLSRQKCPRDIRILESLPRTATGKVQRYRLRDLAAEA